MPVRTDAGAPPVPAVRLPSVEEAGQLRQSFLAADPFSHIVLSDVIGLPSTEVVDAFPSLAWDGWSRFDDTYQRGKVHCSDIARIPEPLASIIHELNAPSTLATLEALTGIERLIPDPYLEGGGLHGSGPGGVLTPHTDFHIYRKLGLYRQLNLIVYLNPDWPDGEVGGGLGLYGQGREEPAVVVPPTFGTGVLFRTDDRSRHGFAAPVPEGCYRRSVAVYYYSATEASAFSGDTNTYWDGQSGGAAGERVKRRAYRTLLLGSRTLSWLAHRVNPDHRPPSDPG
jgi:hypothetical protein